MSMCALIIDITRDNDNHFLNNDFFFLFVQVMPLMSAELLKFPSLSLQYFKTITLVCELYPEKICNLNHDLRKNLFASLELGLTGIGVDTVFNLSCEFLQVLCNYVRGTKKNDLPILDSLRPFLKVILFSVKQIFTPLYLFFSLF